MGGEAAPATDIVRALRQAAWTGLVAALLLLPLIGLNTVQNIRNELVLETRWPLLGAMVAALALGRLAWDLLPRQRVRRAFAAAASRPGRLALGAVILGLIAAAARLGLAVTAAAEPGLAAALLALVILGAGAACACAVGAVVTWTRLRYPATSESGLLRRRQIGIALRTGVVALLVAYPLLMLALTGFQGAIKWIDNYGVQILIYVMLGWGLNIVVGLAGLLDLGYVAFYAVGAYSYALLAMTFGLTFWILLPMAGCLAALWGVLLGFPVLRLRGDYLAIVTLAFGEIIRLILINWVPVTNGYAGIGGIPRPTFFGIPFNASEQGFAARFGLEFSPIYRTIFLYYVILALALLTAAVTTRLRRLPIGRAWEALREDEIACRSLGINTTNTKLTAFAMGAMFAGFAGSFFATRQGFISPESFTFMESAVIVAIVVLGGMGSLTGVAIAAAVMIGGTEIMRELDFLKLVFGNDFDPTQYRMLLFGFAMVLIMIWRPRGLIATREPSAFLHEGRHPPLPERDPERERTAALAAGAGR
ncbi:MAG TPA: high-affinity branched-chain amino acid ABC transporter permease LivM [Xanthobacteraceae bacterium]|jgi:branched-chain amino acid transport system permease protein